MMWFHDISFVKPNLSHPTNLPVSILSKSSFTRHTLPKPAQSHRNNPHETTNQLTHPLSAKPLRTTVPAASSSTPLHAQRAQPPTPANLAQRASPWFYPSRPPATAPPRPAPAPQPPQTYSTRPPSRKTHNPLPKPSANSSTAAAPPRRPPRGPAPAPASVARSSAASAGRTARRRRRRRRRVHVRRMRI